MARAAREGLALHELNEVKPTKAGSLQVVEQATKQSGNTPAVCRKCYIHPAVLEGYLAGSLRLKQANISENASEEKKLGMWAIERDLIRFLEGHRRRNQSGATLKAALRASLGAKSRCVRAAGVRHSSGAVSAPYES
jgi:DNA topoisomerase IB